MAEWTEDTTDNVRALLAFVDEFHDDLNELHCDDITGTGFTGSDTAQSVQTVDRLAPPAIAAPAPTNTRSSTVRGKRRREEMIFLRAKVRELELQLGLLENNKRGQQAEDAQRDGEDEPAPSVQIWERVAQRQYEQRHRAELENARLRQTLGQQIKLARSLERLLERSAKAQLFWPPSAIYGDSASASPWQSANVENELLALLPSLYEQREMAFADPRFETVESHFSDARICLHETQALKFEFLTARIVPFDVDVTSRVAWHMFQTSIFPTNHDSNSTEDTFVKNFCGPLDHQQRTIEVRGKIAARRYIEQDRVVIVSAAIAEPIRVFGTHMKGVVLRHHSWRVIQRPTNPRVLSSAIPSTQVQFQQVITNEKQNHMVFGAKDVEDAMHVWNARIDSEEQAVENMLVQLELQNAQDDVRVTDPELIIQSL